MVWLLKFIAFAFSLLQGGGGVLHASMDFVIAGNLKSALYGNQVKTSYDYNARHHLRRMRTVNSAQTLLANFDYDGAGSAAGSCLCIMHLTRALSFLNDRPHGEAVAG